MNQTILLEDLEFILSHDVDWERLAGKTVLVTGANGFLPAYMVDTILRLNEKSLGEKARVLALARNTSRAEKRFAMYQGRKDFALVIQDVCEEFRIDEPIDFIVHGASQASPKYFGSDPIGTLSANVLGTRNALVLAERNKTESFLFFSSGEVCGKLRPDQMPMSEGIYGPLDPTDIRACYAESKRMGELMCSSWRHQRGIPTKVVRPFHTYGPGMRLDDGRVFADFVSCILQNRDLVMHSEGTHTRAFCYLADATAAYFKVLLEGDPGIAYNVGNDAAEISIRDLAEMLVRSFPEKGLKVVCRPESMPSGYLRHDQPRNCPDLTRIRALGWSPSTSLETGFRRTVRSYL
jgi:UDP-glucuronate decarboxylase